jgi:hypothetical protein
MWTVSRSRWTDRERGHRALTKLLGVACVVFAISMVSAPVALAAPEPPQPPKLDVKAAMAALSTEQIYRAPGSVATYDEQKVRKALGSDMKLLVEPFTGTYEKGHNYPTDDQYTDQVYTPMEDWANEHKVKLIDVTGLYVRSFGGDAFGPSDIPELRTQTAYLDVTSALLGMINYERTGATHFDSLPGAPIVAPTAAQLATLTDALRAKRVYNAPGRDNPITLDANYVTRETGFTVRVAAFPAIQRGQPMVDYASALAEQFPGDDIFVSYGDWMDVAGPDLQVLESARDYAYGRYEDATLEQGADMADRIATILVRAYTLIKKHPFSRPQPTPFDLRHRISSVTPWVLLGSAVLLAGGSLLAWQRKRGEAVRVERIALNRESALATAAIAALGAHLLHADTIPTEATAAAAERQSTASTMFEQATTSAAMREVRTIAEQGEEALHR